jgi:hypothetical protein
METKLWTVGEIFLFIFDQFYSKCLSSVIKNVRVDATFQQLDKSVLEKYKNGNWSILEFPVLHIFCSECNVSF